MSGFRADCREVAGKALASAPRLLNTKTKHPVASVGCLFLAPLLTLSFWLISFTIRLACAAGLLALAIVCAAIGGGFHRGGVPLTSAAVVLLPSQPPSPPPWVDSSAPAAAEAWSTPANRGLTSTLATGSPCTAA